jgi:signal transduction histidine kinase
VLLRSPGSPRSPESVRRRGALRRVPVPGWLRLRGRSRLPGQPLAPARQRFPGVGHAARVAAVATLVVAIVYAASVTALDLAVASRLRAESASGHSGTSAVKEDADDSNTDPARDWHTERLLLTGEILTAPLLLLAVFGGSLTIGLRALAPVERSRRRQLEFTADASHELRTPLSVISAEADIALGSPRKAAEYRDALVRIQGEGKRLGRLVEDMLWLARFDSHPPTPGNEPLDLTTIATECAERFSSIAQSRTITISSQSLGGPALITAPPEWIDQLAGVLMDNACRYAGTDGHVRISVIAQGSKVSLSIEDSGPGIPPEDRRRLFDRFHRATEHGAGTGLGLAIADSIVRSTGGRWEIGDSPLGGASFSVTWRHS